ncbi:hypothetical protein [Frigoriglobus tundricola]|uniref:Uncharacterized protein n=1 Tax=Frigoriglobus tundricola TaxID=2774151 RepID=A0A6M5YYI0_9BACT|nr:hypothetical protein [Frigoriglobus tundricola]QJW98506.1 hypothetical protein FTUN_6096 [Frigoriglobus tundricola]
MASIYQFAGQLYQDCLAALPETIDPNFREELQARCRWEDKLYLPLVAAVARRAIGYVWRTFTARSADITREGVGDPIRLARSAHLWRLLEPPSVPLSGAMVPATWTDRVGAIHHKVFREALQDALQFLAPFTEGRGEYTTYFPIRLGFEGNGALVRLTVHVSTHNLAHLPRVALAPWSGLHPLNWKDFEDALDKSGYPNPPLIRTLGRACYRFEFSPLDEGTVGVVEFRGKSFGFAGLLALSAASQQRELGVVVSTGHLQSGKPGAVDALRAKARAIRLDRERAASLARFASGAHLGGCWLPVIGGVKFFCPSREQFDPDEPYFGGNESDVLVEAIDDFCEREVGGRLRPHVELIPVRSWEEFERDHLPELITDPFAQYRKDLEVYRCSNPSDESPLHTRDLPDKRFHLLVSDFNNEPIKFALRTIELAPQYPNAPSLDQPVPLFLDLSECTEPLPSKNVDPTDWILEGIICTHRVHHLPSADSGGFLRNLVSGRARLFLIVFSARSELTCRFEQEKSRVRTVLRYAGHPHYFPTAFIGSDTSHAELIRQIISK